MPKLRNLKKKIILYSVNHIFNGTRFFKIKRFLLNQTDCYEIGENTKVVAPITNTGKLIVGDNCWVGTNLRIHGNGTVYVGNNCDIAPEVVFITGTHLVGGSERRAGKGYNTEIRVGNGCWLCACSKILPDVSIGNSVVIGAGTVVNKDVPDNILAAGVPCKIKKTYI